jgi:YD repeat-containing protein
MLIAKRWVWVRVCRRFCFQSLILGAAFCFVLPTQANVLANMPDYYSEPGSNPHRDATTFSPNEHIDPFTGGLQLRHVDVFIPGDGGLNLTIQRVYNSNNVYKSRDDGSGGAAPYPSALLSRSPFGMGWSLHFGRVTRSAATPAPCDPSQTDDVLDNPVLELPDGSQQILVNNDTGLLNGPLYITKDQWVATCITPNSGLLVVSPDGTQYRMDHLVSGGTTYDADTDNAWYTTQIKDRNGNTIDITYTADTVPASDLALPHQVKMTTGGSTRIVNFSYTYDTSTTPEMPLLSTIAFGTRVWHYTLTQITDAPVSGYYQLTQVTLPANNLHWNYSYWNKSGFPSLGTAGHRNLETVTYPFGGQATYDYAYACLGSSPTTNTPWTCTPGDNTFYTLVVSSRQTGGPYVTQGTWTYAYSSSDTDDTTTVTLPSGKGTEVYKHYGFRSVIVSSNQTQAPTGGANLWKIGLLKEKKVLDASNNLVEDDAYTWGTDTIHPLSTEQYVRPPFTGSGVFPRYYDDAVYVPELQTKAVTRDGTTYTTSYSNFITSDLGFNPATVTETGKAGTQSTSKTTQLTYYPRTGSQNIVHRVKNEKYSTVPSGGNDTIARVFDSNANVTQLDRFGVTESYDYWPDGNLYSRTNARGKTWTYSNYVCGIPETESYPEPVTVSRNVDSSCDVTTETNGRGKTTQYTYDNLDRIASITRPLTTSNPVSISWSNNVRTVARGSYSRATTYDGFGRVVSINTNGVTQNIQYDALGVKSFESYYSASTGDNYTTDVLGRLTQTMHADNKSQFRQYQTGNKVAITDENGNVTTYTYRSFGDPDKKDLVQVDQPGAIRTVIARDLFGHPTSVVQGLSGSGLTRNYSYGLNYFLLGETNPETGNTVYGRDQVGNMTTRTVGASGTTTYAYDGLNRLTNVTYPSGSSAPAVNYSYDGDNHVVTLDNTTAVRNYAYDDNDNLLNETLTVGAVSLFAGYSYDQNDQLDTITYPSGRVVTYAPNALGRPTEVAPYLTGIQYFPNGVPQSLGFANGLTTTSTLDSRQWLQETTTGVSGQIFVLDLGYSYDGKANVKTIDTSYYDAAGNPTTDHKALTYDGIDRLTGVNGNAIVYDAVGNITSYTTPSRALNYTYDTTNRLTSVGGSLSEIFGYDAYGNVATTNSDTYTYDDASNLRTVVKGGVTSSYDYDGGNDRVHALRNGTDDYYFTAHNGRLLGEYDNTGTWTKEYAYLGSTLVTTVENVSAPGAPSGITVPATSGGTHTVSWGAATGALTGYELEQSYNDANFATPVVVYSGTALSASVHVTQDGTYYYRVRGCNDPACSAYVTGANGVAVTFVAPSAPASLTVPTTEVATGTAFPVSWSAATGTLTRYELWQDTQPNVTNPATQVYSGPNLTTNVTVTVPGTFYYYVRACNDPACSGFTASTAVVALTAPGVPGAITGPAEAATNTVYTLSWTAASGTVTSYELQQDTVQDFTFNPTTVYSGIQTSASLSNATANVYYYRVRACNSTVCGTWASGSSGVMSVTVLTPPSAPGAISAPTEVAVNTAFTVSWGAATGSVTKYELQQDTQSSFATAVLTYSGLPTASPPSTSLTLATAGTYYYRVRACNNTICGVWASAADGSALAVNAVAPPGTPSSLTYPSASPGGVPYTVVWGASTAATYYELQESNGVNLVTVYSGPDLSTALTRTPSINVAYFYRVRACNVAGCSGWNNNLSGINVDKYGVPGFITVPATSSGTHTVSWGATTGGVTWPGYRLEQSTSSSFTTSTVVYTGTGLSATVTVTTPGTYYYRVKACDVTDLTCGSFYTTGSNGVLYSWLETPNRFAVNAPPDRRPVRGPALLAARRFAVGIPVIGYTETRS